MMWVYIPYLIVATQNDDPGWIYDLWADAFFEDDANFQRCARPAGPGEAKFMATTFTIRGAYSYSYIAICADAQQWIRYMAEVNTPPTLYDFMNLPPARLAITAMAAIDLFGLALDFALLTQMLHVPIVLQGLPDSWIQVTGYGECKHVSDPGNAGT